MNYYMSLVWYLLAINKNEAPSVYNFLGWGKLEFQLGLHSKFHANLDYT